VKPRIGITAGADRILEYERAVRAAGGEPVTLAPEPERADADLCGLAGLVLSGGADVDPARFDQAPHPRTELATPARDAYEIAIARAAYERGLPTLAICRGIQVANVAFGGSLVQHVPDVAGEAVPHAIERDGATFRGLIDAHVVGTVAGSRLARLVGPAIVTGSRHHQAVDRVAEPFVVVARTRDGIVEALETRDAARFWLGVQWHPESTVDLDDGASRAIFRALIDAATA
jgi:putative glutamine amidotransferase